jgi:hypothetical protein
MISAVSTFWQDFVILIVWVPLMSVLVSALELAAKSGSNPNEAW